MDNEDGEVFSGSTPSPSAPKSRGLRDLDANPQPSKNSDVESEMSAYAMPTMINPATFTGPLDQETRAGPSRVSRRPFRPSKYLHEDVRIDVADLLHHYGIAGSDNDIFVSSFVATMSHLLDQDLLRRGAQMVNIISPMHPDKGISVVSVPNNFKVITETLQSFGVEECLHASVIRDLILLLSEAPDQPSIAENMSQIAQRRRGQSIIIFLCMLLAIVVTLVTLEERHTIKNSAHKKNGDEGAESNYRTSDVSGSAVVITTRTQRPGRVTASPSMSPPRATATPSVAPRVRTLSDVPALVNKMTMAEKHSMLHGVGFIPGVFDPLEGFYVGNIEAIPRLGIPSLKMQDAGQGFKTSDPVMIGQVTSWACALALASTWDTDLVYAWATAAATEYKSKGSNVVLGPGVNVHRVARGGRNVEYLSGEDPLLGSVLVKPWIHGFQNNGVLCVVKHFGFNNQETQRELVNSIIPDATAAWEVYYPPFKAAIDAGVAAFMCSYNSVNGTHSCSNEQLLKRDLKQTMGFQGFVMSDWWATHSTAVDEGLDLSMPGDETYFAPENLAQFNENTIDAVVTRILTPMVEIGLFDSPGCSAGVDCNPFLYEAMATNEAHKSLALRVATESVLLLQNENSILPLGSSSIDGSTSLKIAVVGSTCNAGNDIDYMLTSWVIGNYYTVGGSGRVIPESVVTIVDGLRKRAALDNYATITLIESLTDDVPSATAAISAADVVIVCGGGGTAEESDRASLYLDQNDFIVDVAEMSLIPVVVVMLCPGPVLTPFKDDVDAIVALFLGGASTGDAIAAVLFGDHNPGSKSPVTFPINEYDTVAPCEGNYWEGFDCEYSEGLLVGYKALDAAGTAVAFPFGHGLSFTTFHYSWVQSPSALVGGGVTFEILVSNVGNIAGTEVVQVYGSFPSELGFPSSTKSLKSFTKLDIGSSLSKRLLVELGPSTFQKWNNAEWNFVGAPGNYIISIGSSSRDIRLSTEIYIDV